MTAADADSPGRTEVHPVRPGPEAILALPEPDRQDPGPGLFEAIERRRSRRGDGDARLDLTRLARLLHACLAVRRRAARARDGTRHAIGLRPTVSAGALHPLACYLAVRRVAGLAPGLYRYLPDRHGLEMLDGPSPPLDRLIEQARAGAETERRPDLVLVLCARPGPVAQKYGNAAPALILADVGAVYQQVSLVATALDLAACPLGGAGDAELVEALTGQPRAVEERVGALLINGAGEEAGAIAADPTALPHGLRRLLDGQDAPPDDDDAALPDEPPEVRQVLRPLIRLARCLGALRLRGASRVPLGRTPLVSMAAALDPAGFADRARAAAFGRHVDIVSGIGDSPGAAALAMLREGLERYALAGPPADCLLRATAGDLGDRAVAMADLVNRSDLTVAAAMAAPFRWVRCLALTDPPGRGRRILVPAQLVYLPWRGDDGLVLRAPISTGAAFGHDAAGAILRGLLEALERHHLMASFYERRPAVRLNPADPELIEDLARLARESGVDLALFRLNPDGPYAVVLALWLNRAAGPGDGRLACGLGSAPDLATATRKAIREAAKTDLHVRDLVRRAGAEFPRWSDPAAVRTMRDRALYWAQPDSWLGLAFLEGGDVQPVPAQTDGPAPEAAAALEGLLSWMAARGWPVLARRMSGGLYRRHGAQVWRVICPPLQPLHLDERLRYDRGPLLDASRLDLSMPHPFL